MSKVIVKCELTDSQLKRVLADFLEAVEYDTETGFETNVIVEGFDRDGKPIYIIEDERQAPLLTGISR